MKKKLSYQMPDNPEDFTFKIGMRDETASNHWREVSGKFPSSDKKRIFIFPGSGTNSAKAANGMCKVVKNMLGENLAEKCEIFSLYWPNSRVYTASIAARTQQFFDSYIVPQITQQDEEGNLQPFPAEKAAQNLRQSIFVTHCYGGFITEAVDKELDKMLESLGYSREEQRFIHRQLVIVHHNNINESIGHKNVGSTNIYRSSKADEENTAEDFRLGSIQHYIQAEVLTDDEVLYVPVSENERMLLIKKITEGHGGDHNGGYWRNTANKTETGRKEEMLFNAILRKVVQSENPVKNWEQFVRMAAYENAEMKESFRQALDYGKEYGDSLIKEKSLMSTGYAAAAEKIKQGEMTLVEVARLPKDVLFALDENDDFLLDVALTQENYSLAAALYQAMQGQIGDADRWGNISFKSANHKLFSVTKQEYVQSALALSDTALFEVFAKGSAKLDKLDYSKASDEMLLKAAELYVLQPVKDVWYDKINYFRPLVYMAARCEKMKQTKEVKRVRKIIENKVFSDDTQNVRACSLQHEIQSFCSQFEATELMKKTQQKWKNNLVRVSTDIRPQEAIKFR